ncbi:MAG: 7-carboxy-7-deazaguanine synthase [Pseudomonadota bacterium]
MPYYIKEIFHTLQGEGQRAGRAAVFCRFSGCNLWTGREEDRAKATCRFCDTDFVGTDGDGGGVFENAEALAAAIVDKFPYGVGTGYTPYVVLTGGEPTLQLDTALIEALHKAGCEIGMESNGTREVPYGVDWITISPKAGAKLVVNKGHELKVVWPQEGMDEKQLRTLERLDFDYFLLQPCDNAQQKDNVQTCVEWCQKNPQWRLCIQMHKVIGVQ